MEVKGLSCPECGGAVPLAEGARVTTCTACGTALLAQGDLGHASYSVSLSAPREQVMASLGTWWRESDKAKDLATMARVTAAFPVFVPVWRVTGLVLGWILGEEKQKRGNKEVFVPVERRVFTECDVNRAACDLGELGIQSVDLAADDVLAPFEDDEVEKQGMIFRPMTPASEVRALAEERFREAGRQEAAFGIRVKQAFLSVVSVSLKLVYYPLWVVRYEYRQGMYQVTADGGTGRLLYGRAPGNDTYRVRWFLVGIGGGTFILTSMLRDLQDFVGLLLVVAAGLMYWGYRAFRYGGEVTIKSEDAMWLSGGHRTFHGKRPTAS